MARACAFCGGQPVTREHVWPAWFRRFTGDIKIPFPHRIEVNEDGRDPEGRDWQQPPFDMTVRAFCESCNSGWMSEMEEKASVVLLPIYKTLSRAFHRRQLREVASWALLRAIVFDQIHPEQQAVPASYREYLFQHRQPPDRTWVWLTVCDAEEPGVYSFQGMRITDRAAQEAPEDPTVFVVTVTLGPLVFQVAGSEHEPLDFDDVVYPQLDVTRIWPDVKQAEFRPKVVMNRRTLDTFATAIFDDVQGRVPPAERFRAVRDKSETSAHE